MSIVDKPEVESVWGEDLGAGDVTKPDNVAAGWQRGEKPPSRQRFNWILKWLSKGTRNWMQTGIPVWDETETYPVGACVRGSDSKTYQALQDNIGKDPASSPSDWTRWGHTDAEMQPFRPVTTGFVFNVPGDTTHPLPINIPLNAYYRFPNNLQNAGWAIRRSIDPPFQFQPHGGFNVDEDLRIEPGYVYDIRLIDNRTKVHTCLYGVNLDSALGSNYIDTSYLYIRSNEVKLGSELNKEAISLSLAGSLGTEWSSITNIERFSREDTSAPFYLDRVIASWPALTASSAFSACFITKRKP